HQPTLSGVNKLTLLSRRYRCDTITATRRLSVTNFDNMNNALIIASDNVNFAPLSAPILLNNIKTLTLKIVSGGAFVGSANGGSIHMFIIIRRRNSGGVMA